MLVNLDVVNSCLDEVNDGGKLLLLLFRNYARFILYFLGDNDVNVYQLGIDAANMDVVNSYLDWAKSNTPVITSREVS